MCKKILKILFITVTLLYQLNAQSKTLEQSEYNRRYLSNYFYALLFFISLVWKMTCLVRLDNSTLSLSKTPILPTPNAAK